MEEGRAVEAEVDEGRVHAREHPGHLAEVDVADDAAVASTLDVELGDDAVLDDGDAGLADVDVDDDLVSRHWDSVVDERSWFDLK